MATIYVIKNKCNDKMYVGQCLCNPKRRFETHCAQLDEMPIHKAMQELGVENFYFEVLDTCSDDIRLDMETYYIDKLNTLVPNGYNFYRHSSAGFTGYRHADEALDKMSNASRSWWDNATEEEKCIRNKKISDKLVGIKFTDEHRAKISEFAKTRIGERNSFYGKKHSELGKKRISEGIKRSIKENGFQGHHIVVRCYDKDKKFIQEFFSINQASIWAMENMLTKNKNSCSVAGCIKWNTELNKDGFNHLTYNHYWKTSGECNDYPTGGEIPQ